MTADAGAVPDASVNDAPAPAVVVVNFGSAELLDRHLTPLRDAVTVVVVDNFSTAGERARVQALAADRGWELVAVDGNPGFGAGVNLGVERARRRGCREVVLLNPDASVEAPVLAALGAHVRARPHDLVCPRIVDGSGSVVFAGSEIVLRSGALRRPQGTTDGVHPWLTGACLAVSLTLFDRLGGFAEDYFLYWEDVDLSYRAVQAGGTLVVRDDLSARHDEGGTHADARARSGPGKSALYYRWNARNRLLFAARNLPTGLLLSWLVRTPAQSWAILLRGGRRQLLASPEPWLAIGSGSVAGVAVALRELAARARRRVARPRAIGGGT